MNQLGTINKNKLFKALPITATHDSIVIDLNLVKSTGNFSIHYEITGTGTVTLSFLQSNNGDGPDTATNFVAPSGGSVIGTALVVGSDLLPLETILSRFLIIRALNVSLSPVLTLDIGLQ